MSDLLERLKRRPVNYTWACDLELGTMDQCEPTTEQRLRRAEFDRDLLRDALAALLDAYCRATGKHASMLSDDYLEQIEAQSRAILKELRDE